MDASENERKTKNNMGDDAAEDNKREEFQKRSNGAEEQWKNRRE